MKEKIKVTVLAILVAVFAITVGICALAETDATEPARLSSSNEISSAEKEYYILKEYRGKLGVFVSSKIDEPLEVLEVYISDLPERDAEKLKKGITASTKEKIMQLAEDYE